MPATQGTIRVIAFREGDSWVAQCLEYDIGAQAPTIDELEARLMATIQCDKDTGLELHGEPFGGIGPAPQHFFELWERRSQKLPPMLNQINGATVEVRLAA